jgi:hypothetical protein
VYEDDRLPTRPPVLPVEVTHLWVADDEYRIGICWVGQTWQRFRVDG